MKPPQNVPMRQIPGTELDVFPLCLGGNVFGWTADDAASFSILDAYCEAGGNFLDTADAYSAWAPGNRGGESETIIGRWMAERGTRQRMVVATKVGALAGLKGLAPATIRAGAEASLRRLGVAAIDLYYAHVDDMETPIEQTLSAFDGLVREGKVRYIGASNFTAPRLAEALRLAREAGSARYVVLQTHYNLMHRHDFEHELQPLCSGEGLGCMPYFALARGFLTGKYRPGVNVDSVRAAGAGAYLGARGLRVLEVLDDLAATHRATVAAVSLAWLRDRPTVVAPIASARTTEQLMEFLPGAQLVLDESEIARLTAASSDEK